MASYKDLTVWQKSMSLVMEVYRFVKLLPTEERFALSDQMRRCSVSIPSNIAEGQARNSHKEFIRFLCIAQGSRAELETQIQICIRLNYITEQQSKVALQLCDEISRMIRTLIQKEESYKN